MSDREKIIEIMAHGSGPDAFREPSINDIPGSQEYRQRVLRHNSEMALHALDAAGYVVTRKEPTEAMRVAGGLAIENAAFGEGKIVFDAAGDCYRAMIAGRDE